MNLSDPQLPDGRHESAEPTLRRRWLGLPVIDAVEGSLAKVVKGLPHFGRQPFTMMSVNGDEVAVNPYLDMVYRVPLHQGEKPIPVGIVSKNYRLVDPRALRDGLGLAVTVPHTKKTSVISLQHNRISGVIDSSAAHLSLCVDAIAPVIAGSR